MLAENILRMSYLDDDYLTTVPDYIRSVRRLLQDQRRPYRYSDNAIVEALNMALLEARRLRADLFVTRFGNKVPCFSEDSDDDVPMEPQFRLGFVHGIVWQVLEQDQEDVNDARAATFMASFHAMLTGVNPTPIQGGTPAPGSPQR